MKNVAHKTIASSLTPDEIPKIFTEVYKALGTPNVVIYNDKYIPLRSLPLHALSAGTTNALRQRTP